MERTQPIECVVLRPAVQMLAARRFCIVEQTLHSGGEPIQAAAQHRERRVESATRALLANSVCVAVRSEQRAHRGPRLSGRYASPSLAPLRAGRHVTLGRLDPEQRTPRRAGRPCYRARSSPLAWSARPGVLVTQRSVSLEPSAGQRDAERRLGRTGCNGQLGRLARRRDRLELNTDRARAARRQVGGAGI